MIRLAIAGALGRTGRRVTELALGDARFRVVAALTSPHDRQIGEVVHGGDSSVTVTDSIPADCDVLIDFSLPEGTMAWLDWCQIRGTPMIIGVTGHSASQRERMDRAAAKIAVLHASNFSLGIAVLRGILGGLTKRLGEAYDVEIVETHHRRKADAPSGTALTLRDEIARARGRAGEETTVYGREGRVGERPVGQIGVHAVRMGDVVGRHEVHFSGPGETITFTHEAHSRDAFASGALRAAAWILGKPAGSYSLRDIVEAEP